MTKLAGIIALAAGIILMVAGAATWVVVTSQLEAEAIVVPDDASCMAGEEVGGPITAYCQADIINQHALDATGGLTYAEMEREDPLRAVAMNASFLRASLFTSVVAYGVAAMAIGLGVVLLFVGIAIGSLGEQRQEAAAASG